MSFDKILSQKNKLNIKFDCPYCGITTNMDVPHGLDGFSHYCPDCGNTIRVQINEYGIW